MADFVQESAHAEEENRTRQQPVLVSLSSNLESMPAPPLPPPYKRFSQDSVSPSPRDLVIWNSTRQPTPTSDRSSASSSNIQVPLLSSTPRQQGFSFSPLPSHRAYIKSWKSGLNPISLFKQGWINAKKAFHHRKQHQSKGVRRIEVDANRTTPLVDERTGKPYVGNRIRSNKYTPWTFVPRQLVAQFSKLANIYFLCFAIMQLIPGLSTTGNYTNIIPLMVFVSISMAKEGFDDYRRHRLDKKENRRDILIIDTVAPLLSGALNWQKSQWRYLRVGNIIKINRNEPIPADIVLLSSARLREGNLIYVETIALDGETNLKTKQAAKAVGEACITPEKLVSCSVEFVIEDPNPDLSTFKGRVTVNNQTSSLTNNNIIYRGSVLRNTSHIIAMVVYSGEECKIRMNASGNKYAGIKAPRLQFMLNRIVILVVCLVVGLSIYNTLAYRAWKSDVESKLFYLSSAFVPIHEEIFGFIIMFGTMVPLSLYVSMEMIKLAQIFFLNTDVDMYDERSNIPFEARTSTINEDLGQVTHIFSDKTGTLTDNEMEFRKLYLAGTEWTYEDAEVSNKDTFRAANWPQLSTYVKPLTTQPVAERNTTELVNYMTQRPDSIFAQKARLMLRCMALCHSCIPEATKNGTAIDFQASSPDELALVRAAQKMGFLMRSRDHETITLALSSPMDISIRTEIYEVLHVIDFSNERRRMSVIVRFPNGRICVICKGADAVIMERLKSPETAVQNGAQSQNRDEHNNILHLQENSRMFASPDPRLSITENGEARPILDEILVPDNLSVIEDCIRSVNKFASESLRTLIYAYRFLDEKEYSEWRETWEEVTTSLSNHERMIETAGDLIEVNLELAGATAVEDKLQKGVPESIEKLCRANIKIWMLTGDKRETAINIGHSCGLIKGNSTICTLNDEDGSREMGEIIRSRISTLKPTDHNVVVVEGHILTTIFNDPSGRMEAMFFELVILAHSVICCRAQPSQKAQVVSGIRKRVPSSVTLAIGDGANDIAMIQEAHIGIGITGKEGFHAARSSDYSIAQFRFLQKLLLVHGRWNYIRTCKYALGTLWKEVVFFLTQALFQRWNGFTGTSLYEPWSLTTFNTLFTSLPVLVIGIFEKDLAASTLLAVPELYKTMGQKNGGFNFWIYFGWTAMAVAESMIVYFCMLTLFANAETGGDNTLFSMGDLSFVAVVIVISTKLQVIEMHNKSLVALLSVFLSAGAVFLWNIILAAVYPPTSLYKVRGAFFHEFGQNPTWWTTLIFIVICVYVFEFSVTALRKTFFPTDTDIFQELEQDQAHREWFEETAALGSRQIWNRYRDGLVDAKNGVNIQLQDLNRRK